MSAKRDFFGNIQKLMHYAKYRCNSVFFILLSQAINFTVQRRILPLFSLLFRNTNYATRLPHITKYATHNKRMLRHFYQTPIALKQENLRHLSKAFFFCIFGHTRVPKSGSNQQDVSNLPPRLPWYFPRWHIYMSQQHLILDCPPHFILILGQQKKLHSFSQLEMSKYVYKNFCVTKVWRGRQIVVLEFHSNPKLALARHLQPPNI